MVVVVDSKSLVDDSENLGKVDKEMQSNKSD